MAEAELEEDPCKLELVGPRGIVPPEERRCVRGEKCGPGETAFSVPVFGDPEQRESIILDNKYIERSQIHARGFGWVMKRSVAGDGDYFKVTYSAPSRPLPGVVSNRNMKIYCRRCKILFADGALAAHRGTHHHGTCDQVEAYRVHVKFQFLEMMMNHVLPQDAGEWAEARSMMAGPGADPGVKGPPVMSNEMFQKDCSAAAVAICGSP
jgi:hypothetical protein